MQKREIPDALALWPDLVAAGTNIECGSYGCSKRGMLWPGFATAFCVGCYVHLVECGTLDKKRGVKPGQIPTTDQLITLLEMEE